MEKPDEFGYFLSSSLFFPADSIYFFYIWESVRTRVLCNFHQENAGFFQKRKMDGRYSISAVYDIGGDDYKQIPDFYDLCDSPDFL